MDQQIVVKEEHGTEAIDRKQNYVERKQNYQCEICQKTFDGLSTIWQHYGSSHFSKNLSEDYASVMDFENLKCLLCGKIMKQKKGLLSHIGIFHLKVNEILSQNGYQKLEVKESKRRDELNGSFKIVCVESVE